MTTKKKAIKAFFSYVKKLKARGCCKYKRPVPPPHSLTPSDLADGP